MNEVMPIRRARAAETPQLAGLYAATVRALGPQLYSPEQVAAWAGYGAQLDPFRTALESAETFVWDEGGAVLGFCTIAAKGYVSLLYVAADATRRGIGGRLLTHAMNHVATHHGVTRFTVHASYFSRALFARHGFELEAEEHVDYGGVPFHRYFMARDVS